MGNDYSRPEEARHDEGERHQFRMDEFDLSLEFLLPVPLAVMARDEYQMNQNIGDASNSGAPRTTNRGQRAPEEHHHPVNLDQVKSAWRAFQGWALGNKLSLGMSMSIHEINYLTIKMRKLPLYFRPSKLHFWDNSPAIETRTHHRSHVNQPSNTADRSMLTTEPPATFFGLCQDSVKHIEVHGFGGVPPLQHLFRLQRQNEQAVDNLLSLHSVRLYHLDLRGMAMGSLLKEVFCFEGSNINTVYMAKCQLDLEMLQDFAGGIATLDKLETLVFVHCSMTDGMLRVLLDNLAEASTMRAEILLQQQQQQHLGEIQEVQDQIADSDDEDSRHGQDEAELLHLETRSSLTISQEQEALNDRRLQQEEQQAMFGPRAVLSTNSENENTPRISSCLDLCVHANELTVVSISHLADFLSRHELLRSVTLHANPQIDALLTTETPSCPQLNYFLEVIQTQNTSLRHFSWHNCKHHHTASPYETASQSCEFCQQMDVIFRRNRWLALSQKLSYVMDQTPPSVWPFLLVRLQKENNGSHYRRGDDVTKSATKTQSQDHCKKTNRKCSTPDSESALYAFMMDKYVELVLAPTAKGCSCQTCRIGIGWCLTKELEI